MTESRARVGARDGASTAALVACAMGALFTLGAGSWFGLRAALSVAVGAAIAVANLLTLRAIIRSMLRPPEETARTEEGADLPDGSADLTADGSDAPAKPTAEESRGAGRRGGAAWGIFAVLKIFVLFGGVWLLLARHLVEAIPLVVGYGVLPLGITGSALIDSLFPARRAR